MKMASEMSLSRGRVTKISRLIIGLLLAVVLVTLSFVLATRIAFFLVNHYAIDPTPCELIRYGLQPANTAYVLWRCPVLIGVTPIDQIAQHVVNELSATKILTVVFFALSLALIICWASHRKKLINTES
jgi:hypothetical protein